MSIEVASFIAGCILLGVAIIGGGFEIQELRIPRVGPLTRMVSLFAGGFFILLGLGWAQFQAEMAAGTVDPSASTSFAPGGEASGLEPGRTADIAAEPVAPAASETVAETTAAAEPGSNGFSGFTGRSRVSWVIAETRIDGVMDLAGESGTMVLSFLDPETGVQIDVEQDLILRRTGLATYYESYNSRFAGTQELIPDYLPDFFFAGEDAFGGWTFVKACDRTECSAITVEPV